MTALDPTRRPTRGRAPKTRFAVKFSDLTLAFGIAAIITLMVLPLPSFVLDALIAINIAIGIVLLMISIYIEQSTEFSVFPSLLLITTLYRLSLSIATTRMILMKGEAGKIIDTFGNVAAGGNLVIGLVVFLIITVVQFVVIAKGAERVAEVAARFSLDAMPGKQMAIDSDLKAGLTDKDDARRRRRMIELESKLCGSLDGAMKFVKGDAIAGIVILIVNLLGGLTIGVLQHGLPFSEAVRIYSVLTIGDGMVTQLPSVLAALAAGLIVTRAIDETKEAHLADAIRRQFANRPRILLVAGLLAVLMAAAPGFPALVFLAVGMGLVSLGVWLDPVLKARVSESAKAVAPRWAARGASLVEGLATVSPGARPLENLVVEIPGFLDGPACVEEVQALTSALHRELGVNVPPITFKVSEAHSPSRWRLMAYEVEIASGSVEPGGDLSSLRRDLRVAFGRNMDLFVGLQETATLLNQVSATHPDLAKEAQRAVPLVRITDVLRRLLEEQVSIRNLPAILEGLVEAGQREKEAGPLAASVRVALRRSIVSRHLKQGILRAVTLDSGLETQLRETTRGGPNGLQAGLNPLRARKLVQDVRELTQRHGVEVILASAELRYAFRKLIEPDLFDVAVLAYTELPQDIRLEVLGALSPMSPANANVS